MKPKAPDLLLKQIEREGLPMPDTEAMFHPQRKWRVDYLWRWWKLALEIEGGLWIMGRHNRPISMLKDFEKYNELAFYGFYLLRFTPQEVKSGKTIQELKRWFLNINAGE